MTAERADPNLRGLLIQLAWAFTAYQVIHVGTHLGIPDLLADGPKSSNELAEATNADPAALYRLLRGLDCLGITEESDPGQFALTSFGAPLRADHPDSIRNQTLFYCGAQTWENWGHLLESVRMGKPVYELHNRPGPFEGGDDEFWTIFNAAMSEGTRQAASGVAGSYDFSPFRSVVDVGGGDGTLIGAILTANDGLRGYSSTVPPASRRPQVACVRPAWRIAAR
ncbi:MAG TPA: methyltransferase [Streptosporangiaceae bacterium]|nr:methyltransferase [Streptosporangiaceae bacterium]